ncbi:DNA translocase FtsK 4TM domain-containing protein, partial [Alphaproteobacteria bacterium]|nr:DNA translocase FtsK 4TM domain-containing protein [Alphaproteobacteria bacterium]
MNKKNKINIKYLSYKLITVTLLLTSFTLFLICLISYNEFDPSPFSIGEESATNKLGNLGAYISSVLIFIYGHAVWLILLGLILLSSLVVRTKDFLNLILLRIIVIFFSTFMISISISAVNLENGIVAKVLL